MGLTTAGLDNGGQTDHYSISYDDTLTGGLTLAQGLLDTCEADWELIESWFSGVNFRFFLPISVQIINAVKAGGSWPNPPDLLFGFTPTVVLSSGDSPTVNLLRYLLVSEVTEMFMTSKDNGWVERPVPLGDEGSKGEGLSRFLAGQFKIINGLSPGSFSGFLVVSNWLNSNRTNFVDNNPDDIQPDPVTGCTTCFLYYLHDQLGFSSNEIINAGASTLADVYANLTGKNDGWQSFINLVNLHYPSQDLAGNPLTYSPAGDNIFPLSNLSSLQDEGLESGSMKNAQILLLDRPAMAQVNIDLTSDNPAVLTVPPLVTIAPGNSNGSIPLQAAAVIGPTQSVGIHASYAGATLSSNIQITPRQSKLAGIVTDSATSGPLNAEVVVQSQANSANVFRVFTDAQGAYQVFPITPGNYAVSAVESSHVPGRDVVAIGVGVPETTKDFALIAAQPFTIKGKVTDAAGGVGLPGATVGVTGARSMQVQTDSNGHYSLSMNPRSYDGPYTIATNDAGYAQETISRTIPNGATITKDFTLQRLGWMGGLVLDENQQIVAGATITVGSVSVRSNDRGRYVLTGLTPGANHVTVSAFGFDTDPETVTILSGTGVTRNFILVRGSAVITGTVTDGEEEGPLSGVIVHVGTVSTKTDADGNYTFSNIPAGRVRVTASAKRYQSEHSVVQLSDHQTVHLDFQLYRTQSGRPTRLAKAGAKT
jgi:protocatechuate 3,4-dioxygenase beta subunit